MQEVYVNKYIILYILRVRVDAGRILNYRFPAGLVVSVTE